MRHLSLSLLTAVALLASSATQAGPLVVIGDDGPPPPPRDQRPFDIKNPRPRVGLTKEATDDGYNICWVIKLRAGCSCSNGIVTCDPPLVVTPL